LNARQCRETCGLRAKNKPLTTSATLRRTARTAKHEDARYASARKTQRTTRRTKDDNAGQPGTTQGAQLTRSQKAKRATQPRRKMLCRLTLELSGGAAVRLNEMLDGCDAARSGDNDLPTSAQLEQPTPQNYQL
jgi:hypothetical protein